MVFNATFNIISVISWLWRKPDQSIQRKSLTCCKDRTQDFPLDEEIMLTLMVPNSLNWANVQNVIQCYCQNHVLHSMSQ
jgi:hypothetical protein